MTKLTHTKVVKLESFKISTLQRFFFNCDVKVCKKYFQNKLISGNRACIIVCEYLMGIDIQCSVWVLRLMIKIVNHN